MQKIVKTALLGLIMSGCASMFIHGGDLVGKDYEPRMMVNYRLAEGTIPPGASYHLLGTEDGRLAFFERSADGSGVVFSNQWEDSGETHFFGWVGSSHGYEYVVPNDHTQAARKYIHPAGFYSVAKDDHGVERPESSVELEPVAILVPEA